MALLIQARRNRLRALRTIAQREDNIFAEPAVAVRSCRAMFQSHRAA